MSCVWMLQRGHSGDAGLELIGFASQFASEISLLRIKLPYESQLFANQCYILMYQLMMSYPFCTF